MGSIGFESIFLFQKNLFLMEKGRNLPYTSPVSTRNLPATNRSKKDKLKDASQEEIGIVNLMIKNSLKIVHYT